MKIIHFIYLYSIAIVYTVFSLFIKENGIVLITVFGFGLPVLIYLLIEWIIPPVIAFLVGYQSRWSNLKVIYGIPLVFIFTVITPFISGKNTTIPTNVPWLSRFPNSLDITIPIIKQRLIWWLFVFLVAAVLGTISKKIFPPRNSD